MWWWVEKEEETEDAAIYKYGVESQEATGKILLDKTTNDIVRIKLADNDYDELYRVFAGLARWVIPKEGYPQVKSIAIG